MKVLSVEVSDFRNIIRADVSFGPAVNFICGPNGHGKTNLVEAISFLSWLKSFRTSKTADLIRAGQGVDCPSAYVAAEVDGIQGRHSIRVEIGRGFRRVLVDGSPVTGSRDTMKLLPVSCLSPDDPGVLEGGPDGRRILVDRFAAMLDPARTTLFSMYAGLVRERNALLRHPAPDPDMFEAVEQNLAGVGAEYVAVRLGALGSIAPALPSRLHAMAGTDLDVSVGYRSRWLPDEMCGVSAVSAAGFVDEAACILRRTLGARRTGDSQLGYTSAGPHTDDVDVGLEGLRARGHASRGQKKILMLAWKAAEAGVLAGRIGFEPVLVLDDALADLDLARQSGVVDFLLGYRGQSFITSAVGDPGVFGDSRVIMTGSGRFTAA